MVAQTLRSREAVDLPLRLPGDAQQKQKDGRDEACPVMDESTRSEPISLSPRRTFHVACRSLRALTICMKRLPRRADGHHRNTRSASTSFHIDLVGDIGHVDRKSPIFVFVWLAASPTTYSGTTRLLAVVCIRNAVIAGRRRQSRSRSADPS